MIWGEFFHMGGYAPYVWASWGLTMAVLLWQFIQPKRANAKIKADIKRQIKREVKLNNQPSNTNNTKHELL